MVIIAYRAPRPAKCWPAHSIGRVADGIDAILVALPGWIIVFLVWIAVEFVQWPIPYRGASVADALADAVGACVLALAWWSASRFVQFVPVARWTGPR